MVDEKVIDKIRKLLALAQSPNENEAMVAAEKAQKLLAEYNLSMNDVAGSKADNGFGFAKSYTDSQAWRRLIAANLAPLYFCDYFFNHTNEPRPNRSSGFKRFDNHVFVGRAVNLEVVTAMFGYLLTTIDRLEAEAWKKARRQGAVASATRQAFKRSFHNACAGRLSHRLAQKRTDIMRPAGLSHDKSTLPALYENELNDVREFMQGSVSNLKTKALAMQFNSREGIEAGSKAGSAISLETQIDNKQSKHLLA